MDIKKGQKITKDKIKLVRPYKFFSTSEINRILNKKAKINLKKGQPLSFKSV